jgi:hypothetical protein
MHQHVVVIRHNQETERTAMTPLDVVVTIFGNARRLALALGITQSAVCRWENPKHSTGVPGAVPPRYHRRLLELANLKGKPLTLDELYEGRPGPKPVKPAKNVEKKTTAGA